MKLGGSVFGAVLVLLCSAPASAADDGVLGGERAYVDLEVGPQYVALHALKEGSLVDGERVRSERSGVGYGVGLGLVAHALTLGARLRYGNFDDWQLRTAAAEAGLRLPLAHWAPYVSINAGYAVLSGIHSEISTVQASGISLGARVGVDWYLARWFSLGASSSVDVLFLDRRGDGLHRYASTDPNRTYRDWVYGIDGSGTGLAGTVSAVLGLHL